MSRSLCLLVSLASVCACLSAAKKPITVADVVAERPGSGAVNPIWSPDGKQFLYQERGKAILYDVASKKGRELFSVEELTRIAEKAPVTQPFSWQNRRVRDERFQWFPDGKQLLVSAGGELFIVSTENGQSTRLTNTPQPESDPKLSPDGRSVAYRQGHELYLLDLASRQVKRLTHDATETRWNGELDWVYPEELDLGTAFWWSPDSRSIAYMQFDVSQEMLYPHADLLGRRSLAEPQRYPQAGTPNADVRVGVLRVETSKTQWLDLGETKDKLLARVDWTPDSRSVAVQVLNRVQNQLDFLLADAESGKSRQLLRETDKAWVNVADDLYFFKSASQFLWSSERSGYRHLYLYGMDGKLVRQLTSGSWEVASVAGVDEPNKQVYYLSAEMSPLQRHLYRVGLNGGERKRLSSEMGSHTARFSPSFHYYIDNWSSLTEPPRSELCKATGEQHAMLRQPDRRTLEDYELLPTKMVNFRDADGTVFYGRMIQPPGFDPAKKYPAIVFVYGGPHSQTVRNAWTGLSWEQALAHKGFVIWQMDNRGSAGRGHAWEASLYRRFGAKELEDQQKGLHYLLSLGFVDPARVGIYGWSYGGFMTMYALTHAPQQFRAGVAGAPVTNWHNYDTIYTERYLGLPSENEEGYKLSSPVSAADKLLGGNLLLVHNFEDDNVLFQNSMQMIDALEKADKQFDLAIYPQKSHGVSGPVRRQMLEKMTAFFEAQLNDQQNSRSK